MVAVIRYIRSEHSWVGPIEIIQAGSPERAMSELLYTDSRDGAENICGPMADNPGFLPALAELNRQVTIVR